MEQSDNGVPGCQVDFLSAATLGPRLFLSVCAVFTQSPEASVSNCWEEKQTVDTAHSTSPHFL